MDVTEVGGASAIGTAVVLLYKIFGGPLPQIRRNGNGGSKTVGFSNEDTRRKVESWAFEGPRLIAQMVELQKTQTQILQQIRDWMLEQRAEERAEKEAAIASAIRKARDK